MSVPKPILTNPWLDNPPPISKSRPYLKITLKTFDCHYTPQFTTAPSPRTYPYHPHPDVARRICFYEIHGSGSPPTDIGYPGDVYAKINASAIAKDPSSYTVWAMLGFDATGARQWRQWTPSSCDKIEHPNLSFRYLWCSSEGISWCSPILFQALAELERKQRRKDSEGADDTRLPIKNDTHTSRPAPAKPSSAHASPSSTTKPSPQPNSPQNTSSIDTTSSTRAAGTPVPERGEKRKTNFTFNPLTQKKRKLPPASQTTADTPPVPSTSTSTPTVSGHPQPAPPQPTPGKKTIRTKYQFTKSENKRLQRENEDLAAKLKLANNDQTLLRQKNEKLERQLAEREKRTSDTENEQLRLDIQNQEPTGEARGLSASGTIANADTEATRASIMASYDRLVEDLVRTDESHREQAAQLGAHVREKEEAQAKFTALEREYAQLQDRMDAVKRALG